MKPASGAAPQKPSRALLRFFDRYLAFYVPRHFHALRLAHSARFPRDARPLIVCINHASWWDPLTSIVLSRHLLPQADHYAPIDALALGKYGILRKLGLFPVEQNTPRGGVQFLRAAQHILADANSLLWLTPQGHFTDVRTRPVVFKSGLDALLRRLPQVTVVPLAYEYTFWDERLPELLANCGEPVVITPDVESPGAKIEVALARTQDELAELATLREAARFEAVMAGGTGVSGVYSLYQRARAALTGKAYRPEHGSIHQP
jgi:1-acyl-sn-glycerol-3-phosphate acyltransferase